MACQCREGPQRATGGLLLRVQCVENRSGILRRDPQQRLRRSFRFPSPLLPVLQSSNADTDHEREFTLQNFEFLPDCLDFRRLDFMHASGFPAICLDLAHILNAGHNLVKMFFLRDRDSFDFGASVDQELRRTGVRRSRCLSQCQSDSCLFSAPDENHDSRSAASLRRAFAWPKIVHSDPL